MIRSPTQAVMDSMIFRPTRRSRNRKKPIPPASEVQTFDYVYGLRRSVWDRTRSRRAK
ncbi:NinE family protein [Candidatus Symbiopectobacterium sp. NZEC135]|uniref:NinE family protein n=1 Tax=Candidatus Symbiopectobacterium sp. NZEC135 TaxID=2820471 RepID=UPI002227BDC6|nr:NinE family protein [Candidatus Symbiopectobacterium sp. NZEC135]MCW2477731.1 NinE family protein [Candidatus Symbiopectobacterium sp. NZEC135]